MCILFSIIQFQRVAHLYHDDQVGHYSSQNLKWEKIYIYIYIYNDMDRFINIFLYFLKMWEQYYWSSLYLISL